MSTDAVTQTWYMTQRQLVAVARQPAYLVMMLIQPVIWLFLFGNLFKKIVELGGFGTTTYLDYLIPGIVVMSALNSSMWAGMGTLEEIERGTLNRFLTTPVSRSALMNANVVQNGISTALQSVIIVLLGLAGERSTRRRGRDRGPRPRLGAAGRGLRRVLERGGHAGPPA